MPALELRRQLGRRTLLQTAALLTLPGCGRTPASSAAAAAPPGPAASARLLELERKLGGRWGVAALDTETGKRVEHRAQERFAMCSTFKLALAAAVLARVDAGHEQLARRVRYDEAALLEWAPVTRAHVSEGGLSVEALCAAAVSNSDNTAANLLLETLGGPAGMTQYFRSLGDESSRLDRNEPLLNTAFAGDVRDTTTPSAMLRTMQRLLLEDSALSPASRARLLDWLIATKTGLGRLRAGFPASFRAGDKTGTGNHGAICDLAIAWPPQRRPILLAVYAMGSVEDTDEAMPALTAAMAEVGRGVCAELGLS